MSGWERVRLGEVLRPAGEVVRVREDEEYPNFGIYSFGRGLFRKPPIRGLATSASSLVKVKSGQFIYSRLFAFEGAYGLVGPEFDGAYVSNEYPVFDIDESRVVPRFLLAYVTLPTTWSAMARGSKGVGVRRQRVQPVQVLGSEMPLPPLAEQQRLVAQIEELASHLDGALALDERCRVETDAIVNAWQNEALGAQAEGWIPIGRLVAGLEAGSSPLCDRRVAGVHEWGVLKVGAVSFGRFDPNQNKALPQGTPFDPHSEVRDGDLLISRANTVDLVGACCVARKPRPRLLLSDKTLRFRLSKPDSVLVEWLDRVLKSPALREQVSRAASGTSPTMKNISKDRILALRVPPHDERRRREFVAEFDSLQAEVDAVATLRAARRAELDALMPAVLDRAFAGLL